MSPLDQDQVPNRFVACNRLRIVGQLFRFPEVFQKIPYNYLPWFEVYADVADADIVADGSIVFLPTLTEAPADGTIEHRKLSNLTFVLPILMAANLSSIASLLINKSMYGENVFCRAGMFEASFSDGDQLITVFDRYHDRTEMSLI